MFIYIDVSCTNVIYKHVHMLDLVNGVKTFCLQNLGKKSYFSWNVVLSWHAIKKYSMIWWPPKKTLYDDMAL
jgi:hypothetical protein